MSDKVLHKCSNCNEYLPKIEFYADKSKPFGVSNTCKTCSKEYQKLRRLEQADLVSEQRKASRLRRIEEVRAIAREYYKNNSDTILANDRKYYLRNREYILNRNKEYAQTDIGKLSIRAAHSKYRASKRLSEVEKVSIDRLLQFNPLCFWCNKPHNGTYHLDHFYPLSNDGMHILSNLVISCPSCNLTKSAKDPLDFAVSINKNLTKLFEEDFHEW